MTIEEVLTAVEVLVTVVTAVVVVATTEPEGLTGAIEVPKASPEEAATVWPDAVRVEIALLRMETAGAEETTSVAWVSYFRMMPCSEFSAYWNSRSLQKR